MNILSQTCIYVLNIQSRLNTGYGPVEVSSEHGNEPSDSVKCWEVLEWLHKNGSAP
jgi:hypothetical protein